VELISTEIENKFGTLREMMPLKLARHLPLKYKELELVLIRKLFKLNLFYLRYQELKQPYFKKRENDTEQKKW
jgi:hypothetical protein